MWYKNWNIILWSEAVSTGYSFSSNHWQKEPNNIPSVTDLAEGIKNLFSEYLLQQRPAAIIRDNMKYVDFKGREWSLEKGDWISYQLIEKHNQHSIFNKSIIKKFFYAIFLALLTAYFWLA